MGQVALKINGRSYEITCDDGQEEHLREVGAYFDSRVRELAGAVGQVGEGRLLVIAGLLVADELFDAKDRLERHGAREAEAAADEAAEVLDGAASRIDTLARKLAEA
ncbi:cell division protein ZapA [Tistlia consotensis]|uniref:Cell division protein ZapA n=1 Tax=Tistlia consotensis USBA 355 TaxID=560819 RepID=A0A1Y6BXN7_9PROT|nr:cell division protein ZapA [Tistlia consotensis]SMF32794.1 cell division protein ZapA [Tistlia consotensis USBA 355]SNR68982.1 cell division protein ZapA [Tistlia consotensis]